MSTTAIPAVTSSGQPVLILKEGTAQTRGREAQRNNITAAKLVGEIVRTSLGPRGMDKMLVDSLGDVTITNDGATILKEIDVQHPAAKAMVEISKATDNEVGDGTTSAVVLASALLEKAEELIDKDVHPTVIVDGYKKATDKAREILSSIAIKVDPKDREWLSKIAYTSMATKLVSSEGEFLSKLVVDALLMVAEEQEGRIKVDIDDVKVEKKAGGSLTDTKLVKGIILDKEVVHNGMPKRVTGAKIALLNCPLEIEKTEFDAKININNPEQIKMFLEEENNMLKGMVDKIVNVGANVVICQKGIDDIAQHYLAKSGVLAVRRAKQSDIDKLSKATGGRVITSLEDLSSADLGKADLVEERRIEEDKWVFVEGCQNPKSVTLFVRGGTQRVVEEAERAVHDALCVVRDVMHKPYIVVGAGAPESEVATKLFDWAQTLSGREQLAAQKFAEAVEVIPLALAENAGMDPIDTLVELRAKHSKGEKNVGVNTLEGKVEDATKFRVYEPIAVKEQIFSAATEAATMILRIDDVIASSKTKAAPPSPGGPGGEGGPGGYGGMGE
ncbi:MAG: thermosome subunit beta [Nitrososphaeria archaeon]